MQASQHDHGGDMDITWKHTALRAFGHQHWILHGRDRIIRIFHHPGRPESVPFEVDFFGMRYRGDLNNFIDWTVFYYGACPRNELYVLRDIAALLQKTQGRPVNFYDIGANTGHHTLFMAPRVNQILAFEPFGPVREKLYEKIEYNKLTNVTAFPVGLGDEDAELDFFEPQTRNSGMGTFVLSGKTGKVSKLQVRKGDGFFAAQNLPPIDLMKIDVEGFEMRVLHGLEERIRRDRPVILMELSQETKEDAQSEEGLRKHLYEDAEIFTVGGVSISSSYRLWPLSFNSAIEILVIPKEKLPAFASIIPSRLRKSSTS